MTAAPCPDRRMTVTDYLAWGEARPPGRFELVEGRVVAMSPERVRHNLVKLAVAVALQNAVRAAGLPCTVFTDGVGIAVNKDTVREPDASVQCGVPADLDAKLIEAPVIVVEVTSPSSERDDQQVLLVEYFSVPSIRHYLIVLPEKRAVVHHHKTGEAIATRIVHEGEIVLDPPGMTVAFEALLGPAAAQGEN
ncbi:Uma2 family endonuclease [Blastochloris sulfoviridis]|uniref:Uma2 family endonuclease n=1 Tax=Blastochloris sulfoviridis TaxID=50712 RepID=A0A5M6HZZ6_9HYPH|nr:Uma2 family endonuclease [Blastochloris sulfoviridis]KAA5601139.1 Uma2 family endonuclease [Blastochloris sulfoviridis]